jgi:nucleotide-binding universal stress UspA family protein
MSDKSILLELDGSAQARYAAEVAWSIAQAVNCNVDAQHVVDSLAAWDFLSFDIAGFIGSGPYFEAHETMKECLTKVGRNLIDVYGQLAKKNNIEGEAYLDEGSTIREICFRAKEYGLVVMGHQPTGMQSPGEDKRKLPRRSVTEALTHYVPRPLLLVQDRCRMWTKARIVMGAQSIPAETLQACWQLINDLSVEPYLRVVLHRDKPTKMDKTAADGIKAADDFSKYLPDLPKKSIDVRSVEDIDDYLREDAEKEGDVLIIVPVVEVDGIRRTGFGVTPEHMVRYLNHPAILFYMPQTAPEAPAAESKSVSTAV